jgi:YYY domain-containing protein
MGRAVESELAGRSAQGVSTQWAPNRGRRKLAGLLLDLLLIGCIVLGISFRFRFVNWNEGADLHPDEYGLTSTLTQLHLPNSLGGYFNTRSSPLSPYQKYAFDGTPVDPGPDNRMRWGQWPLIIIRSVAELTGNTGYGELRIVGRRLSALADTLILLLLYLIGKELYSRRVGLLASAFSALAVLQIQQSHFMTVDNFASLFAVAAMYFAIRVAVRAGPVSGQFPQGPAPAEETPTDDWRARLGVWRGYLWFGAAFGMAMASRVNLLPLGGIIVLAAAIANRDLWPAPGRGEDRRIWAVLALLALAMASAAVTFRLTQPMSFRAETGDTSAFTLRLNPDWVDSMKVAASESRGVGAGPPGEQWTNRTPILFPLTNIILWGLGAPLGLTAWGALAWAAWRTVNGRQGSRKHMLPLVWAGGYFLFMGTRWVKSVRYFLPIYPFLSLFAAWGLIALWDRVASTPAHPRHGLDAALARLRRAVPGLLGGAVLVGALLWASGFVVAVYGETNTRLRASRWVFNNIPAAANLDIATSGGLEGEPLSVPYGTRLAADAPLVLRFNPQISGELTAVRLSFDGASFEGAEPRRLTVILSQDPEGQGRMGEASVDVGGQGGTGQGNRVRIPFGPTEITEGNSYFLILNLDQGAPIPLAGSAIANESWDEGLPLRIDGRDPFGGLYRGLTMQVRWADDENKRAMFLETLESTDYIILPSQRSIWSISRLPLAYPMTMEYYRALFDGRLGFDLAATFDAPIRLGDLVVSDVAGAVSWGGPPQLPVFNRNSLAAEEAFSVYDHAPVWIFKKRADFSMARAREILESVDLAQVVPQGPREASRVPASLLMLPGEIWEHMRAGGTWSGLFPRGNPLNRWPGLAVIVWWLSIGIIGLAASPLTRRAFPGLGTHSYPLARIFGLLLLGWAVWISGSLGVAPSRWLILTTIMGMAGLSALLVWRGGPGLREVLRRNGRYVLSIELLALGCFALMLAIRLGNPDLWHPFKGGEKPMDFAYLNAVLKSSSFPPYDPWFAGGYINYYYFGYVLVGMPIKLLGIDPALAYNLVLPTLFSLLGLGVYTVASALLAGPDSERSAPHLRSIVAGLGAVAAVLILGNLGSVKLLVDALVGVGREAGSATFGAWSALRGLWITLARGAPLQIPLDHWYWNPSRAIPPGAGESGAPITEFPFFTFLYGDLHAHMIAFPLTLLALAWALSWVVGMQRGAIENRRRWWFGLAAGGLIIGSLRPTNTWDLPLYLLLGGLAAFAGPFLRARKLSKREVVEGTAAVIALAGIAFLAFLPYSYWYGQAYTSMALWRGSRTPLGAYLLIHGLFLLVIAGWLLAETREWLAHTPVSSLHRVRPYFKPALGAFLGMVLLVALLTAAGYAIGLVALPLAAWAGILFLRPGLPLRKRCALLLVAAALGLTMLVEIVVLSGDIGRMNTVFKFYLQAWVLFGVTSGAALAWLRELVQDWAVRWRMGLVSAIALVVLGSALYPMTATPAKIMDRMDPSAPHTLDGMAYMRHSVQYELGEPLDLSQDYRAIWWMREHVVGSPVIVEASVPEYHWGSRYSIYTGLPTVLGWNWHQRQQRASVGDAPVWSRQAEISEFYATDSIAGAMAFLHKYDVRFVVVGELERDYYAWVGPCTRTEDPVQPLECDLSGRPYGMAAPSVPIEECLPFKPGGGDSQLRCPTHGLEKFERMATQGLLETAYKDGDTIIYQVVR